MERMLEAWPVWSTGHRCWPAGPRFHPRCEHAIYVKNTPKQNIERKTTMDIEKANTEATERMMEARPVLVGLGKARDVIPDMRDNLLLHAGPPITWERASGPMRGAITGALIFEGKAKNEAEAQALVESGEIELDAPLHASG